MYDIERSRNNLGIMRTPIYSLALYQEVLLSKSAITLLKIIGSDRKRGEEKSRPRSKLVYRLRLYPK